MRKKNRPNTAATTHLHPRGFARAVLHNQLAMKGATGVNKVVPGTTQSKFSSYWRSEAEAYFGK